MARKISSIAAGMLFSQVEFEQGSTSVILRPRVAEAGTVHQITHKTFTSRTPYNVAYLVVHGTTLAEYDQVRNTLKVYPDRYVSALTCDRVNAVLEHVKFDARCKCNYDHVVWSDGHPDGARTIVFNEINK